MRGHIHILALVGMVVGASAAAGQFTFRDVTKESGLLPDVGGIAGHGVGWGDVDGDGWADLYVGTFGAEPYGSKDNMLFRNVKGKFTLDPQKPLHIRGRANGAAFVDLDNDGDLDLYFSNHAIDGKPYKMPHFSTPNAVFRNDGGGKFTDVSKESNACPADFPARSVAALDYDGDGLIDLLVGECFFQGGKSRSRLFRNLGAFKFENVTVKVGLPEAVTGFGVAAADVNNDGWPDVALAGRYQGNRLFLNDGKGRFSELPKTHGDFTWQYTGDPDDTTTGVCFGDVNRDGLMDMVIGQHFSMPWKTGGVPVRLYLNRGLDGARPRFEEVTDKVGLRPIPMKAPHVEFQDFDNDGWPDLYTCVVKFKDGRPHPVIFRNGGVKGGLPQFHSDALTVNDFPTEAEKNMTDVLKLFKHARDAGRIIYMAAAPTCDYDRDGRVDAFFANWFVDSPSMLLRNETKAGNWVQLTVNGAKGVNRQGIGSRIHLYEPGKLGDRNALIGVQEVAVGYGYASGQEAIPHFGLGTREACDVEVILPHGKGTITRKDVKANQRIELVDRGS